MAASRRGQPGLHVRLPPPSPSISSIALPDLPPISALFLIDFDVKAGYTISWKASQPGIELEGVVEYKSLPSGLHTVANDLIYFVHDGFAGLSAFINAPCDDSEARNARMLAVGVLVPLSYGRLGRAWRHAEGLRVMATKLATETKDTQILEDYWRKNKAKETEIQDPTASKESLSSPAVTFQAPPSSRPKSGHTRNRSASDGASLLPPGHKLSPFHPAWSLNSLLDTFGPLIFPIHRAALLRKRILISCHAPVQEVCNFVYNISILSNIPLSTTELLSPSAPPHRLRPLFTIGVHDIPFLVDEANAPATSSSESLQSDSGAGWIACTTDSILAMKDTLWDMLITLPPPHSSAAKEHVWPTVECPRGTTIKATQRDLRRFRAFKHGLARFQSPAPTTPPAASSNHSSRSPSPSPVTPGLSMTTIRQTASETEDPLLTEAEKVAEPLSWSELAYSGFMWWASAGEKNRSEEVEEAARDAALLADLSSSSPSMTMSMPRSADLTTSITSLTGRSGSGAGPTAAISAGIDQSEARVELAIIAYFHRLTTQILSVLADVVESSDVDSDDEDVDDEEDDEEDNALLPESPRGSGVRIGSDGLAAMGLDVWSETDAEFVKEVMAMYFGRRARIEGKGVEICGVRVC